MFRKKKTDKNIQVTSSGKVRKEGKKFLSQDRVQETLSKMEDRLMSANQNQGQPEKGKDEEITKATTYGDFMMKKIKTVLPGPGILRDAGPINVTGWSIRETGQQTAASDDK